MMWYLLPALFYQGAAGTSSGCLFRIDASSCRRGSAPALLAFSHCFLCLVLSLVSYFHLSLSPLMAEVRRQRLPAHTQRLSLISSLTGSLSDMRPLWFLLSHFLVCFLVFIGKRVSPIRQLRPACLSIQCLKGQCQCHIRVVRMSLCRGGYSSTAQKKNNSNKSIWG